MASEQADKFTAAGQETERAVAAATSNEEVQVIGFVLQSSVALKVKDKLTPAPHTNVGSAGIIAILEVGLELSVTTKADFQVVYAAEISADVAQADKLTGAGQPTLSVHGK